MIVAPIAAALALVASAPAEREVLIPTPAGDRLAATLTLPAGPGPHPAAVIVGGIGPNDRDGDGQYARLAAALTARGIATLRYDKRGIGASDGPPLSWLDARPLTADARAAVATARRTPGIDPSRVHLVGHSQGGVLALRAARHAPVAGVATLAAPGVALGRLPRVTASAAFFLSRTNGPDAARATLARDPRADARALAAPLLIVHGTRDGVVPVGNARLLAAARRDAGRTTRLVLLPGLGHHMRSRRGRDAPSPPRVIDALVRFIAPARRA
ncbi:MAG: alpha/beta fold hydrolase [Miltoncostaeaceae bacterium]